MSEFAANLNVIVVTDNENARRDASDTNISATTGATDKLCGIWQYNNDEELRKQIDLLQRFYAYYSGLTDVNGTEPEQTSVSPTIVNETLCTKWPFASLEERTKVTTSLEGGFTFLMFTLFCVLPFLHKKVRNNKRPGFPVPGQLLERGTQKWMFVAIFILAVYDLKMEAMKEDTFATLPPLAKYFMKLVMCLLTGVIFYSLAVATYANSFIGYIYGLFFCVLYLVMSVLVGIPCSHSQLISYCLGRLPMYLCITALIVEYTRRAAALRPSGVEQKKTDETTLPHLEFAQDYVRQLLRKPLEKGKMEWRGRLKETVSSYKNYTYSTNIMIAVCSSTMLVLMLTVESLTGMLTLSELLSEMALTLAPTLRDTDDFDLWRYTLLYTLVVATLLAALICVVQAALTLRNYRRCMAHVFGGRLRRLTANVDISSESIMRSGLQYAGFQIGYAVAGFAIHSALLSVLLAAVASLVILVFRYKMVSLLLQIVNFILPIALWSLIIYLVQLLLVRYCFLYNNSGKRRQLVVKNRRAFFNFHYFQIFLSAPLGLFACLKRIIMTTAFGVLNISRLDRSPMDRYNEHFDNGFQSFVCVLRLENTYSNPTMLAFVGTLMRSSQAKPTPKLHTKTKLCKRNYRNTWKVAYTLLNNTSLRKYRKKPQDVPARNYFSIQLP